MQNTVYCINCQGKMSEQKVMSLFKESTDMYCQGNYQACLALLSDCLTLQSNRSILYSNRAIANYHLKQLQESLQDLQTAIRKNHLNYVAYFNLFSLNFLNQNNAQAFQNLCLCLSSAYTVLCKLTPSLQWVQQSLYYGYNNKESLLIKAILLYQKSQLRTSLELLQQIMQLQVRGKNKEGVAKYMRTIENELGLSSSDQSSPSLSCTDQYILRTSIKYPEEDVFEEQLTKLLKEFNGVYRLINDEMQMQHEFKGMLSNATKSQVYEKQNNQLATGYNSITFSRSQGEGQSSTHLGNDKDLNLLSFVADHTKSQYQTYHTLCPKDSTVKVYIDKAQLNQANIALSHLENVYALLSYSNGNHLFSHRTSTIKNIKNGLKWEEETEVFKISPQQTDLKIRILQKKYTSFKDDLIGETTLKLNKYGPVSVPISSKSEVIGMIRMRVDCL